MPKFKDHKNFITDYTPLQMFKKGILGGAYFRDIYSSINGKQYKNRWKRYFFLKNLKSTKYKNKIIDKKYNCYGVYASSSLETWENKGWIKKYDPYGWIEWYINFYYGRRIKDYDDWQIKRFLNLKNRMKGLLKKYPKSLKIKQTLLHWAINPEI